MSKMCQNIVGNNKSLGRYFVKGLGLVIKQFLRRKCIYYTNTVKKYKYLYSLFLKLMTSVNLQTK